MCTRSGARLCSASLPPPTSPSLLSQANEVSENSLILENTEVSMCQDGEPAVRANNPNSVEASIFPSPTSEEDKGPEVLGYENLFVAELRALLDPESQNILSGRMQKVAYLDPMSNESDSETQSSSVDCMKSKCLPKRCSIHSNTGSITPF